MVSSSAAPARRRSKQNARALGPRTGTTTELFADDFDDPEGRTYRDGGGLHGGQVAVDWARAAAARLAPAGRLVLYTGVSIVEGRDPVREALSAVRLFSANLDIE